MNICLVTTEYPPGHMGGVGTYCVILPQLLAEAGHQVTVVTKHVPGAPDVEEKGNLTIYRIESLNYESGKPVWDDYDLYSIEMMHLRSWVGVFARTVAQKLPEFHEKHQFDLVLSQDVEAPTYLLQNQRLLFNKMAEVPFVVFIHSPHNQIQHFNADSLYQRNEYHRWMYESQSLAMADGLIAASDFMKGLMIQDMGFADEAIRKIPYPLGKVPELKPFENRFGSGDNKQRLVVYSGRIEMRKGVEQLIRAMVPLIEEDPGLRLHLIGSDTRHPCLNKSVGTALYQRFIPQEIEKRIWFMGRIPREHIWDQYQRATIGVVPSLWEPFSFACQEMLVCGTPVVATRAGGMAEMIVEGECGLLCAPDNVESLRESLRQALYAPEEKRRAWSDFAAKRIRSYCDNAEILDQTLSYFSEVIEKNKQRLTKEKRFPVPSNLPFGDMPLREPHPALQFPAPPAINRLAAVVPCYNLGSYLDECLESIINQQEVDVHAFVVDDGSKDEATLKKLDAWEAHQKVSVLRFANAGLPTARNRGASAAVEYGAEAIMFIDADDKVELDYLKKAAEVLNRHPEAGAVTAWAHTIGMMHTFWIPPHNQFPYLLAECMSTPPALVRTEAYLRTEGFSTDECYSFEDWDFWVSLNKLGYAMLVIPEPLIFYRMREGSLSREYKPTTKEHGRRVMLAHHRDMFEQYGREAMLIVEGMLYTAQEQGDQLKAQLYSQQQPQG